MYQKYKTTESATSKTLFHNIKFGLRKAFKMMFEIATISKEISALQLSKRYSVSYGTTLSFTRKVTEAMKSIGQAPMKGKVNVDEVAARYKKISQSEIRQQLKQVQTSILIDNSTNKLYTLPSKIQEDAYKILLLYDIKHITIP